MLALTLTSLLACQPSAWAPHCEAERSPAAMADVQESTGLSGDTLMRWFGGRHEQSAVLPDGSTQTLVIELERDLGEVRHVNQTQASPLLSQSANQRGVCPIAHPAASISRSASRLASPTGDLR